MKILGIDPALTCLGWGVIKFNSPRICYVNSGTVKIDPKMPLHLRLSLISSSIEKVIDLYKPDSIGMEETFLNINAVSSLKLAYVRGALMALIGKTQLPYREFLPNQIKKTIVGVGHADKTQVKHMVKMIVSGTGDKISFDEADALAVAYTCLMHKNNI